MMPANLIAMGCLSWLLSFAWAGEVSGTVTAKGRKGQILDLSEDRVIVFLETAATPIPPEVVKADYVMVTKGKQFSPQMMVIPKGATVRFPNFDPIIHNVFSVSGQNRFDAGRYGKGQGRIHTFRNPGLVRVYCNVHHQMNAVIFVCDSPYFTYVAPDGRFSIKNVPDGEYKLTAIHRIAGKVTRSITVRAGSAYAELGISVKRKRLKPHLNKAGKPYKRRRSERY